MIDSPLCRPEENHLAVRRGLPENAAMQVACCQYDIAWEEKMANYAKVRTLLGAARLNPGAMALLPEMSFCGFSMDVNKLGEVAGGPSELFLGDTAREFGIVLGGGVIGRGADGRGRNQFVAYSPAGDAIARYTKMQPFTPGKEGEDYAAGDTAITFDWDGCRVAPFICYDLRFPELFRLAVRQRPHLFVVIANWPDARLAHWVKLLQARAIENQAYVAGVNRCGNDPKLSYSGRSLVANPQGEIIADGGAEEGVVIAEIDVPLVEQYRRELPFLDDIRSGEGWG